MKFSLYIFDPAYRRVKRRGKSISTDMQINRVTRIQTLVYHSKRHLAAPWPAILTHEVIENVTHVSATINMLKRFNEEKISKEEIEIDSKFNKNLLTTARSL